MIASHTNHVKQVLLLLLLLPQSPPSFFVVVWDLSSILSTPNTYKSFIVQLLNKFCLFPPRHSGLLARMLALHRQGERLSHSKDPKGTYLCFAPSFHPLLKKNLCITLFLNLLCVWLSRSVIDVIDDWQNVKPDSLIIAMAIPMVAIFDKD